MSVKIHLLSLSITLAVHFTYAQQSVRQEKHDKNESFNLESSTNYWLSTYNDFKINSASIINRYITPTQAERAKTKIEKNLTKSMDELNKEIEKEGAPTEKTYKNLFMANTNACLWHAQVQGDDFYILAKRFATGTRINQGVVHDLRDAYIKWLTSPSTKSLEKYSSELLLMGRSYEVLCKMKVQAKVEEGVIIKYLPVNGDKEKVLPLSSMEKVVPAGNYYVWMENEGEVLTNRTMAWHCTPRQLNISITR